MTIPVPISVQISFDAEEPRKLADFWAIALGYVSQPPPEGFSTWEEFGHSIGMPEEDFGNYWALIDPEGKGPRVFFQRVPEGKTVKNRVHLDVTVRSSPNDDFAPVREHVQRLVEAGGSVLYEIDEPGTRHITMRDPEGNEFCVQ